MAVTSSSGPRFDIAEIQANIAGPQPYTLDAHITGKGKRTQEVLTVTLGGLLMYCYDRNSVRAFEAAWRTALRFGQPVLPEVAEDLAGPGPDHNHVGVILRVKGTPVKKFTANAIPSGASPTGVPYVRVGIGRLVVHAFDLASIRSWADGWADAERVAARIWPTPDAFDDAEAGERTRIARTGSPTGTPSGRRAKTTTPA